jgi:hypothetical protein
LLQIDFQDFRGGRIGLGKVRFLSYWSQSAGPRNRPREQAQWAKQQLESVPTNQFSASFIFVPIFAITPSGIKKASQIKIYSTNFSGYKVLVNLKSKSTGGQAMGCVGGQRV